VYNDKNLRTRKKIVKLAQSHQFILYIKSNRENSNDVIRELALQKYTLCPKKGLTFKVTFVKYWPIFKKVV